ncbi:hypothetical protein BJX61DRAFT_534602 [Aspergillus egyptiacus]|nr:hypothetical protein BJX61DRAFT_534602 [Aspergillus egyptiacus]
MRSTNPSPRSEDPHERTASRPNECSSPSVRAVNDNPAEQDERNIYSTTPYPTKPEHFLPPRPGKGHEFVPDSRFHVDEEPNASSGTYSTDISRIADSTLVDQSITDPWDLSSTFDAGNTPPQLWDDGPNSSKSSFEEPGTRPKDGSPATNSDEESTLPPGAPTIKCVAPDSVSPKTSASEIISSNASSPNVVPIGPPSCPSYETLDNSSLNFVRIGAPSHQNSASRSNSVSSLNSLGTVIRYANAAPWTRGSSSDIGLSRPQSFRSIPSHQVSSVRSNSTTRLRGGSHSGSVASSSGSGPGHEIQTAVFGSGAFIQYPTIRAPSSSGSRVESVSQSAGSSTDNLAGPTTGYALDRFKSHLSVVSSRWSAEVDSGFPSPASNVSRNASEEPSPPPTAMTRQQLTSSSVWLVNDSEEDDEFLDSVASLPPRPTNPGVPNSQSSGSRSSSVRSNVHQRSTSDRSTSSSFVTNFLPPWARFYYTADEQAGNSTLSLVEEGDRPVLARRATSSSSIIQRISSVVSRARTFSNETRSTGLPVPDPRDPRSHWVKAPEPSIKRSVSSLYRLRPSWSPHLFPDRCVLAPKSRIWPAPSLDSRTEPLLGRRNIQVWSFCLGFICPLMWFIASFLPLPRKPEVMMEENRGPELEVTLKMRLYDLERRRHLNARWWRNLNRWMTALGLVIITVIITLAIVGTTVGF